MQPAGQNMGGFEKMAAEVSQKMVFVSGWFFWPGKDSSGQHAGKGIQRSEYGSSMCVENPMT